jgi:hypothetical protein
MFASRLITGLVVTVALAPAARAGVPPVFVNVKPSAVARAAHHAAHLQHLQLALQALKAAEGSAAGGHGAQSAQLVSTAIGHTEAAMGSHHHHHPTGVATGFNGFVVMYLHHHHHGHLQQALTHMKAAEKHIARGNPAKAVADIEKAQGHISLAMQSHHHLMIR